MLIYATCTTEPEENEHVITYFLARRGKEFVIDPRPYLPEPAGAPVDEQGSFIRIRRRLRWTGFSE